MGRLKDSFVFNIIVAVNPPSVQFPWSNMKLPWIVSQIKCKVLSFPSHRYSSCINPSIVLRINSHKFDDLNLKAEFCRNPIVQENIIRIVKIIALVCLCWNLSRQKKQKIIYLSIHPSVIHFIMTSHFDLTHSGQLIHVGCCFFVLY